MNDLPEKTIRLGVSLSPNGTLVSVEGLPLPKLAQDTAFDLLVPSTAFMDHEELAPYLTEQVHRIAPAGTTAILGLSPGRIHPLLSNDLIKPSDVRLISPYVFVKVEIKTVLKLRI